MYIPDPVELIEMRGEAMFDTHFDLKNKPGQFLCANCGEWKKESDGMSAASPDPASPPICGDCFDVYFNNPKMEECMYNETSEKFSEKLKYHGNLAPETVQKMKETRARCISLCDFLESLGKSPEITLACRSIQSAMMITNAHLCYVDPQATKEEVEPI